MYVPTVLVKLKVQDQPKEEGSFAGVTSVDFEMSREALASLLDGLGKIKQQLDNVSSGGN